MFNLKKKINNLSYYRYALQKYAYCIGIKIHIRLAKSIDHLKNRDKISNTFYYSKWINPKT